MAGNKSCEENYIASKEAYFVRSKIVERNLEYCRSLTPIQVDTIIDLSKEYEDDDNPLSLKVNIDCSEALTGLKAVQREARKTIQVLKELEEKQKAIDPELFKRHCLCTWVDDEDLPTRPEISG